MEPTLSTTLAWIKKEVEAEIAKFQGYTDKIEKVELDALIAKKNEIKTAVENLIKTEEAKLLAEAKVIEQKALNIFARHEFIWGVVAFVIGFLVRGLIH